MTAEGWLLVTMYNSGPVKRRDPAAWKNVIFFADWINHAIMSYEEVSAGVRALARCGLVVERAGGVLVLSPAARKGFAARVRHAQANRRVQALGRRRRTDSAAEGSSVPGTRALTSRVSPRAGELRRSAGGSVIPAATARLTPATAVRASR
jgi:hypothetical protein